MPGGRGDWKSQVAVRESCRMQGWRFCAAGAVGPGRASSGRLLVHDRGRVLTDLPCAIDGARVISDFRVMTDQKEAVRAGGVGADHPDTLTSRSNLGDAYREAGRLDEAIALYERNLADSDRVFRYRLSHYTGRTTELGAAQQSRTDGAGQKSIGM